MRISAGTLRLVCILALCLASAACDDRKEAPAATSLPPPLVGVVRLERMDVPLYATFMGQTAGSHSAAVRPQVGGVLVSRLFEEGAFVQKGDALFEIDSAPYKAALEQAEAQLASAKSQLENARRENSRVQKLYAGNAVSQQERDSTLAAFRTAQAQVASAQAAVEEARIRLGWCRVESPLSGWTSREVSTVGSLVSAQDTLTYINQSDPMDVHFAVPSVELFSMRSMEEKGRAVSYGQGSPAGLRLLDGVGYSPEGKVVFLDTQVEVPTSAVQAKARFPNPAGTLLPGQFVTVRVGGARLVQALMLPQEALLQTERGPQVLVLDAADRASLVEVVPGPAFGDHFLVESGLEAGQRVVVQGQDKVRPGTVVMPQERTQSAGALSTPDSSPVPVSGGLESSPAPVSPLYGDGKGQPSAMPPTVKGAVHD